MANLRDKQAQLKMLKEKNTELAKQKKLEKEIEDMGARNVANAKQRVVAAKERATFKNDRK